MHSSANKEITYDCHNSKAIRIIRFAGSSFSRPSTTPFERNIMGNELNELFVYSSRPLSELLSAGNWKLHIDNHVLPTMPRIRTGSVELEFFRESHGVTFADLDGLIERRGRVLVDPFGLLSWNLAHPEYSGESPNGTHWKDASDDYFAIKFYEQHGIRVVSILEVPPPSLWTPEWTLAQYAERYSSSSN